MLVYIVNERTNGKNGSLFGGIFSTKEKAKQVADRENSRKNKPNDVWFDYVGIEVDDDFRAKY
ncbi:DUF7336 domain-containing protein [Konateibacter massiliensis]|uniref:DUF7336 domain-containing protein n=1 Tax=Konateibacter massiliensis TaxID=2002841 RepID=UPI000C15F782|nr:hypothetical protein [Konateibacter massiliensis]